MRTLYHLSLCPFSRRARAVLEEKKIEYRLVPENPWERRMEFLALNPAGEVPVLVEPDGVAVSGVDPICEFLDEMFADPPLIGDSPLERAETRRLIQWFDRKFHAETTALLINEKIFKRLRHQGEPDSAAVRAGHANLRHHLDYIVYLIERRRWLAGNQMTYADLAAAAQISCIDYIGDVPWDDYEPARDWYARIKSRPSFRPLLADHLPGVPPSKHYADLDF
ncbi:MAG: glutathione S-transferase family protein [Alphaproteobacteria bacterium]|nr:glutathione S-transferase family protein [Alphaproteobacteria bacterium]